MDINALLKNIDCPCGKTHTCDIEYVYIEKNATARISELCRNYTNVLIVADKNTYSVCGDFVKNQISDKIEKVFIYKREGLLVPDEVAIEELSENVTKSTDLIIGIGSGVIQDLCKYVSFELKLPYYIVATAPSMDGYASKGAAMIAGNMKVTYNAHVPKAIIGDIDVLKNAPMDMIKSGYGDILGKFSCLNDWKLSRVVNDEYFCEYVYNLTYEILDKTKDLGKRLLAREEEAIKILTESLIGVGIAMAYVGNSRPASGSEHHLSHFFEVIGIMKNEPYFMHGTDVAFSAVYTQKIREELLGIEIPQQLQKVNKKEWEDKIDSIYGMAADGVRKLQTELGWYNLDKISVYKERWNEIREVLKDTPTTGEMIEYLESIELDINDFEKLYGKEKIQNALWFAKDLKDRYSVLWLYYCLAYQA